MLRQHPRSHDIGSRHAMRSQHPTQPRRTLRRLYGRGVALLAFAGILMLSNNCTLLVDGGGPEEVDTEENKPNAYTCHCRCQRRTKVFERDFNVCLPEELNPNLNQDVTVTDDDLINDCATRVRDLALGIAQQCVAESTTEEHCTCEPFLEQRFAEVCNGDCNSVQLADDCSNTDTASSLPGLLVCLAEGEPMGAAFFARSTCEVTGNITVDLVDDDGNVTELTRAASGVVEFTNDPCPGESCAVDMAYRLDHVDSFKFSGALGLASVEIKNIVAIGATTAPAVLASNGTGAIAHGTLQSSGEGTRVDEKLGGIFSDATRAAYVGGNGSPVLVDVLWSAQMCMVDGSIFGSVDGADTGITVALAGDLVNQPPTARAGGDQTIECTSPAGASITLDASGSTDPDHNIALTQWRRGGPVGTELEELEPVVTVAQALGTETYVVNVLDAGWQIDQAMATVSVVDTTAPNITAVAVTPAALWPPNHRMVPVSVEVEASDTCGAAPACRIAAIASNEPVQDSGDGNTEPDWMITGPFSAEVRAERAGRGSARVYTLTVECEDASGNIAQATPTITVAHDER